MAKKKEKVGTVHTQVFVISAQCPEELGRGERGKERGEENEKLTPM